MKKIYLLVIYLSLFSVSSFSQTEEEAAIIKLLEKDSATWRSGDLEGHASCWAIKPYSRIVVSTADENVIEVPPAYMVSPPEGLAGKGGTFIHSNYEFSIQGNMAWVSHDEVSYSKEGQETKSIEFRMLEKIKGSWKLVGQSIHVLPPE